MNKKIISIGVVDIVEQNEVLQYLNESIGLILARHADWEVSLQAFQLNAFGAECEYDYTKVKFDISLQHLFIHTKTLKSTGGAFKDELWMRKTFSELHLNEKANVWFFSGDIEEFEEHFRWMQRRSLSPLFHDSVDVHCLDVFNLLYPPGDLEMDVWLENLFLKQI
jgi:hypothetical protein